MSPHGVIFELNNREWFYIVECESGPSHKSNEAQVPLQEVYGPFPNSLIANTHMSSCHCTKACRLIYQDDIKSFFAEEWDEIQKKIIYSRAHPQYSTPGGRQHGL